MTQYDIESIRKDVIGNDILFDTPFGERHLLYADYTASGRGHKSVEHKILNIQKTYANTHTVDDYSGQYSTVLLHKAEERIKEIVNAGEAGKIISIGSGATGALQKLQEILGIYIPPVTRERIFNSISESGDFCRATLETIDKNKPVAFIGPYEHHTNELMWREAFVQVEKIGLNQLGQIDLNDLESKLSNPLYKNRPKIGSFSAGSNITGARTQVYDIARICHRFQSFVFFDFAAVAPYVEINMNKDANAYFDAIFFSPHKFLGGPGSSGILVFNEKIYRTDLPPTTAGGGTVIYVGFRTHDFSSDIETREKAGTPPILQTIKASLAMDLKEKIGITTLEKIEEEHIQHFVSELDKIGNVKLLGNVPLENRVPIVSFNIEFNERILHPKFVTRLMNDLFGIQSRGGCSCAGPFGHLLLEIDEEESEKFRQAVRKGFEGLKPGWIRVNLHFTLTREDIEYILESIRFIARFGHLFLRVYTFNLKTGEWKHLGQPDKTIDFSMDESFASKQLDLSALQGLRTEYLSSAAELAANLERDHEIEFVIDEDEIEQIKFFDYIHREE